MSDLFEEQPDEGIEGVRRRLLAAVAAADLTDEEGEVFLHALEAADLTELAFLVGRPPREVRMVLQSLYRKIQATGLVEEGDLPEVVEL